MSIMKKSFKVSRKEIWQNLSAEIGAQYIPGTFLKGDKIEASHGEWTIVLDTFTVIVNKVPTVYTRLRAPYVNPDGFRFCIYRRRMFSEIAKWFGMQDVVVGHEEFDRDFVIQGTDEEKLRALFASPKLRELIYAQPQIHFSVKDNDGFFGAKFPADTDGLRFVVAGIIADEVGLIRLFEIFAETLEQCVASVRRTRLQHRSSSARAEVTMIAPPVYLSPVISRRHFSDTHTSGKRANTTPAVSPLS